MSGKPWTRLELFRLRQLVRQASTKQLAAEFPDRSRWAILHKVHALEMRKPCKRRRDWKAICAAHQPTIILE